MYIYTHNDTICYLFFQRSFFFPVGSRLYQSYRLLVDVPKPIQVGFSLVAHEETDGVGDACWTAPKKTMITWFAWVDFMVIVMGCWYFFSFNTLGLCWLLSSFFGCAQVGGHSWILIVLRRDRVERDLAAAVFENEMVMVNGREMKHLTMWYHTFYNQPNGSLMIKMLHDVMETFLFLGKVSRMKLPDPLRKAGWLERSVNFQADHGVMDISLDIFSTGSEVGA